MKRTGTLLAAVTVIWTLAVPASATQPEHEFYDTFAEQDYDGNDGTREFKGPWIEKGESNGPTSGFVWVWPHEYCGGGYCLKMGGSDDDAAGRGAYRAVDLTGATSAKLCFDDGRQLLDDESQGNAAVEVSADGGGSWKTLDTISLDKDDGKVSFHESYDILNFATSDTIIRFKITDAEGLGAYWIIDNIVIDATFEEPPTTTTEPEPTTTTTSTTKPPESTTTTHPRDTEMKPEPPRETTTTSTRPDTTTTTRAATTTTTEAPAVLGSGIPPDDREAMMDKAELALPAASGVTAMPASLVGAPPAEGFHIEPLAAFAAAFLTESGQYGGSLIPSVLLGLVIAVVSLIGIRSRTED